ncbi:MAG: ribosome-associated translation inhibitor RaiA [Chloroflexi bacterium]|nr:MAG: ribosome-associated translation inhibitor RaiA [Chloroflexota bacterium]
MTVTEDVQGITVRVKGRNMKVPSALKHQVTRKMRKLSKYLDRLDEIQVELTGENTRESDQKNHVEAATHAGGRSMRVSATHADMQAAIDSAVDKLYRQLVRQKERMKSNHHGKLADRFAENALSEAVEWTAADMNGEEPIAVERLEMKPQFEDEALEELRRLGYSFYVFLNARTEQVNILYRKGNGHYGLIEPSFS